MKKRKKPNVDEQCTKISLLALQTDSVNTTSILVCIAGKQAIALVDLGSNSTFMSLKFAIQTSCAIVNYKTNVVPVAAGGKTRVWILHCKII